MRPYECYRLVSEHSIKNLSTITLRHTLIHMSLNVIVLAAGLGKRMRSPLPKVLHRLSGEPLLFHILDRVFEADGDARVSIVVGHGREQVEQTLIQERLAGKKYQGRKIDLVVQQEQRGTGDAARSAMESEWGRATLASKSPVLVLPGDLPLLPETLVRAAAEPLARGHVMRVVTTEVPEATGYGRIVRRGKRGGILKIVEEKDSKPRERAIREINTSIYLFNAAFLKAGLARLTDKNAQKEFYLTDLVAQAVRARKGVDAMLWPQYEDVRGINDPWELAEAGVVLNERILKRHARAGVKLQDPRSTWIDARAVIAPGASIGAGAHLRGATHISERAEIGPACVLTDAIIGEDAHVKTGTVIDESTVGARVNLGPYAHLRPGSVVGSDAKIGNFVELKKTRVGSHTAISHLSYLGDAVVGSRVNIGCGFVTCNFDGQVRNGSRKHVTLIEDDVFMGSDCQTVAPVKVGKGAFVASGSTITEEVPADALAIARSRQVNKPGYAKKLKKPESE